jgi:hypothetical protein
VTPAGIVARPSLGLLLVLLAPIACAPAGPGPANGTPPRSGRFGSLRDLVLIERPELGVPAALFVDRFEVTRGDWAEFAASAAGQRLGADRPAVVGNLALPMASLDLRQARAFAQWRFLRLPRRSEWEFAALRDGRSRFPWGGRIDPARANTAELRLGGPTPVGTFESGRRAGGNEPYDLVGNVSEWTESVPPRWWAEDRETWTLDPQAAPVWSGAIARQHPALSVWAWPGGILPPALGAELGGARVPREVVGSDFQRPMVELLIAVPAGDRRAGVGVRLCSTAAELLQALQQWRGTMSEAEREQLQRFVARGEHRRVLQQTWQQLDDEPSPPAGSAAAWLRAEFGPGAPPAPATGELPR